ncbi:AarF/UbiB family protein [Micromonospora sp. M12]
MGVHTSGRRPRRSEQWSGDFGHHGVGTMTLVGQIGLFVLGDIAFVLLYTALAVGARRLLGLRVRPLRTVVAATVGWLSSVMFVQLFSPSGLRGAMITIVLGLSLFTTMIFLVVAEILLPHGLRPLTWSRDMRGRLTRIRRYQQVGAIIMRHRLSRLFVPMRAGGALTATQRQERAASLRVALEECGVTSVKLGQTLSARHDLLPQEYIVELSKLHDNVPPVTGRTSGPSSPRTSAPRRRTSSPSSTRRPSRPPPSPRCTGPRCDRGQGRRQGPPPGHRDRGRERPEHRPPPREDAGGSHRLGSARRRHGTRGGIQRGAAGGDGLSYRGTEHRHDRRGDAGSAPTPRVRPPAVLEPFCTTRVLVMEYLEGVPVGSATHVLSDPTVDRRELATDLMTCVLEQILLDGTFHCDPHPGNVLVMPDGGLGLLDYGVVGRLDPMMQDSVQQLLLAIDRNDRAGATDALLEILDQTGDIDKQRLERAVGQFITRHVALGNAGLDMITELMRLVTGYGLRVPRGRCDVPHARHAPGDAEPVGPVVRPVRGVRAFASRQHIRFRAVADAAQGVGEDMMAILPLLRRFPGGWIGSRRRWSRASSACRSVSSHTNAIADTSPAWSIRPCSPSSPRRPASSRRCCWATAAAHRSRRTSASSRSSATTC